MIDAVANLLIFISYMFIASYTFIKLVHSRQLRNNLPALLVVIIFAACAMHRLDHFISPVSGGQRAGSYLTWTDTIGAVASWVYWTVRHRAGNLGSSLYADHAERRRTAHELNDNVVQGLAIVKYALDLGDVDLAKRAANDALFKGKVIMADIVSCDFRDGDLQKERTSGVYGT